MGRRKASATTYVQDPSAREEMILRNLPLVHHVIGRLGIGMPGIIDREDLVAHGVIGLIQAVDRYDPSLGVPFGPWAAIRIRGAVIDAIRELDVVNPGLRHRARQLQKATGELTSRLGRTPTDSEIQSALGVNESDYAEILDAAACHVVSLDSTTDAEGSPLADLLVGAEDPAESSATRASIAQAVQRLDRREQVLLSLYYAEGLTCQEVGDVLGIHKTVVVRLHARAIVKLRALLGVDESPEVSPTSTRENTHGNPPLPAATHAIRNPPVPPPDSGPSARDHGDFARELEPAAGAGGRYAGARRAYLSGGNVELGIASG